jgi:heme exporter protein C
VITEHTDEHQHPLADAGVTADAASSGTAPSGSGSKTSRVIGIILIPGFALWAYLVFLGSPADQNQGDVVRLVYLHVPIVVIAYVACFLSAGASAVWLWKRTQWWDLVAASSAEIGTVMVAATLVVGSIYGRPTWGVYWTWDARLTATAMLMLLLLGYLAVRRIPASPEVRGKRSAIVALLFVPNIVVVSQSVTWWRSLHQGPTLLRMLEPPKMQGLMLFTMYFAFAVGLLFFVWLLIHRFRVAYLQDQVDDLGLDAAIEERREEGWDDGWTAGGAPS